MNIALIGEVILIKCHFSLISVLSHLDIPFKLFIIGSGPDLNECQKLSARYPGMVEFTGRLSHAVLPSVLTEMDISIVYSITEAMPRVILESFCSGCIPISTDVGYVRDLIINSQNGFILDQPYTSYSLLCYLRELYCDDALFVRMASEGPVTADKFNADKIYMRYGKVLNSML